MVGILLINKVKRNNNIATNDISGLNEQNISKKYIIHCIDDIYEAITYAKKNNLKISMFGKQHTMGGQTIAPGGIQLDMNNFNNILKFDKNKMQITVQPGITWEKLIYFLNLHKLSPQILQSYCTFSVGGTISVNAHGITSDYGMYDSIVELKILNDDQEIITCSLSTNPELFSLVIGGYGLFGIIIETTLKIVPNYNLELYKQNLNKFNFIREYKKVLNDTNVNIKFGRIDVTNMKDIFLYTYYVNDKKIFIKSDLDTKAAKLSIPKQILYKWIYQDPLIQQIRYKIEKNTDEPLDQPNMIDNSSRNTILYESAEPLAKLYNPIITLNKTHILQEYFIPEKNFGLFMEKLNYIFIKNNFKLARHDINLLNITIRYIKKDTVTFLKYAPHTDMIAFVFYYRINKTKECDDRLNMIHNMLTNTALKLNGTFYLPYRLHYTKKQLLTAYPQINNFIKLKNKYDKKNLFSNMMFNNIMQLL